MSAIAPRITAREYLDLLMECFMEYQQGEADQKWHPEDLYVNLMVLMHPLALGLSRGRQYVRLDDTFWPKPGEPA